MSARLIGIVAHTHKPGSAELVNRLLAEFERRKIACLLESRTATAIGATGVETNELGERCELILVLGGDGTMLQVVHELGKSPKPLFGINLGSLGFLTCVSSHDYLLAVDAIASGDYDVSKRSLLLVEVVRDGQVVLQRTGLNDTVITRGEASRLIRLRTWIDGAEFTEYNADGLIVATPTGSTAYSLSAGGPVMMPASGVFVITPICPHVLTNRSLVVGDHSVIEIASCPRAQSVILNVDGQEVTSVEATDVIRIRRAGHALAMASLRGMDFLSVLRKKLKWSGTALQEFSA